MKSTCTMNASTLTLILLGLALQCIPADFSNKLIHTSSSDVNEPSTEEKSFKPTRIKDPLVVQTATGLVRGKRQYILGKQVDNFFGIPFAKPPLGELRFKKPLPVEPWGGIIDVKEPPNSCIQEPYEYFPGFEGEQMWNPNTNLSENCLMLSIWAPPNLREPGADLAEVLVWFYGGGYMSGTITLEVYNADLLATANNIVVAAMQYRVGALGYLYLKHKDAPGNMGMYDQVLGMEWLKENVKYFGGNPERITLFGESAGATSVSLHMLSPYSKHLFNRVILESGTINMPWAMVSAETEYKHSIQLVKEIGCNETLIPNRIDKVMECMRKQNETLISKLQWNTYGGILMFPYAPITDGDFVPEDPMEMIRKGNFKKTDILLGSNRDEATFFIVYDYMDYFSKDEATFLSRSRFLELMNTIFKDWTAVEREAISYQYTHWDNPEDGFMNQKRFAEMSSDYFFVCPTNEFARVVADHGVNVYYYYFTHRTSINPWGEWMGVMHADEIDYLFGHPLNKSKNFTPTEEELSRRLMKYLVDFSATGNPSSSERETWPRYTRSKPEYYEWNGLRRGTERGPRTSDCAFWNEFMPKLKKHVAHTSCKSELRSTSSSPALDKLPTNSLALLFLIFILHLLGSK